MFNRYLTCILLSFFFLIPLGFAQDDGLESAVDYKLNKMQKELNLTDHQAYAVRAILKDYMTKRQAVVQEAASSGVLDHDALKTTLRSLKENEYTKLSAILTQEQMQKWIDKENLMASLNPDSAESAADDGMTFDGNEAKFKF